MLRKGFVIAALCAANVVLYTNGATAQCAARDVLHNATALRTSTVIAPPAVLKAGAVLNAWKTIKLGEYPNSFALRNALDAAACGIGDLADEILARPAFTLAATKTEVDLVVVSAVELGLTTDSASLRDIYSRAEKLGLSPAPAEVGPELRLQYFDQPIGEFLYVGMKPITTWTGEPVIFVVVNGGAGLILIGQNGSADTQIPASSAFLFVRPRELPKVAKGQLRLTDEIQKSRPRAMSALCQKQTFRQGDTHTGAVAPTYGFEIRPLLVATIRRLPHRKIAMILPTPGTVSPRVTRQVPSGPSNTAVPFITSRSLQPSMVVGLVSGTGVNLTGA